MTLTFRANRSDGLGERLRAMVNALALADRYGGDFAFGWPIRRFIDNPHHDIRPAPEVFSAEFIARFDAPAPDALPFRRFTDALAKHRLGDLGAAVIDVPKFILGNHDPDTFGSLTAQDYRRAFDQIGFAAPLARAIELARQVPLGPATSAVHARAGDIVYGKWRCTGKFATKAIPFPVVAAYIGTRHAAGDEVLLFGQDKPQCRELSRQTGARDVNTLHDSHGLTSLQAALFDIVLMSRCRQIACGMSGFAILAQIIGGGQRLDPVFDLPLQETLAPLLAALVEDRGPLPAPHPLQTAFACWFTYKVYFEDLTPQQRLHLIAKAAAHDPANPLYPVGLCVERNDPEGLRACLDDRAATPDTLSLIEVADTRTGDPQSALHCWEQDLQRFAQAGSAEAAALLAVIRQAEGDTASARTHAALAGQMLPAAWQDRMRRILASQDR